MKQGSDVSGLSSELVRRAVYRRDTLAVFPELVAKRTAVLVLNMQKAWLAEGAPFDKAGAARQVLPRVNGLARALGDKGATVIWFRHTTGQPGASDYWSGYFDHFVAADKRSTAVAALVEGSPWHDLGEGVDRQASDLVLPKYRFSAFLKNPHDLEAMLREKGVDTIMVAGTATNVCCESTVRDAMMRGFKTFMPHDAVAAPSEEAHQAGLRTVMQTFADVRPVEEILAIVR